MSLVYNPQLGARVAVQSGTLSGNTLGDSTYSGTNIILVGGSNVTLQAQGDSVYIHGASGGTGGGGSTTINQTGPNIAAGGVTVTNGTVVFSNASGVSFGLAGSTMTASVRTDYQTSGAYLTTAQPVGAYLTTAALSADSSKYAGVNGSIVGGSFTLNTSGATISLPAYLTTYAAQTVQPVAASASNGSYNFSTLKFVEGSGVTWATQAGGIQASVKTDYQSSGAYLTTAAQVSHSHNLATTTTNGALIVVATANSAGATIAVPPYLTTSAAQTVQPAVGLNTAQSNVTWTVNSSGISINANGYAGTGTTANNASITLNSAGLAISVAAPGGGAAQTFSAGTDSRAVNPIKFVNANGISFGFGTAAASDQLSASYTVPTQSVQPVNASASNGSFNFSTIAFSNANGVTFGTSAGSIISASVSQTVQPAVGLNTAQSNVTWTVNSSGLSINAAGYAGTGTTMTGAVATLNSNGLALNVNGPALQHYELADIEGFGLVTHLSAINSRPIFCPFNLPGRLTANSLVIQLSEVSSNSIAFTVQAGLYTFANGTSINLLGSVQNVYSASNTGSVSGVRYLVMSGMGAGATALTPGAYVLGLNFSAGNTLSMNYSIFGGQTGSSPVGFIRPGSDQQNTNNTTSGPVPLWGRYTANSAGMPAAVGQANIIADFSGASQPITPWFVISS